MPTLLFQHSRNPISIDILLSVVDNFGDMGFACELMIAYEQTFPSMFHFRVFTDNVEKVEDFFGRNKHLLGRYEIVPYETFVLRDSSDVLFALFHFPLPKFHDGRKRLILRFDYISLDPMWISQNEYEHIESTDHTKIIEIIPSPLRKGAGLIQHHFQELTRIEWLQENGFPEELAEKKWVTMFVYLNTFERIDFSTFPKDVCVFIFSKKYPKQGNIISLPFLTLDKYYTFLDIADYNIVRGEVSFVQALLSGKPFLWDMYKEIGGLFEEQSQQFLAYEKFSDDYEEVHSLLNHEFKGKISYQDIEKVLSNTPSSHLHQGGKIGNLVQETKKHIDRFHFSL